MNDYKLFEKDNRVCVVLGCQQDTIFTEKKITIFLLSDNKFPFQETKMKLSDEEIKKPTKKHLLKLWNHRIKRENNPKGLAVSKVLEKELQKGFILRSGVWEKADVNY